MEFPIIILSAGHDSVRKGAFSDQYGVSEYELTTAICNGVQFLLSKYEPKCQVEVVSSDRLEDVVKELKSDGRVTYAVEFHINALNSSSSGCETLYYHPAAKAFATLVQSKLVENLGNRNRGVIYRDDLGFLKTGDVSIITEPFFMSNPEEMKRFIVDEDTGSISDEKLAILAMAHGIAIAHGVGFEITPFA